MEIPTPQEIKENILIKITMQEQVNKILQLLEEKGWLWVGGEKPTSDCSPMQDWSGPYIHLHIKNGRQRLYRGARNNDFNGKVIPAEEFLLSGHNSTKKVSSYNSFCPLCGSPAFDLIFMLECSNPSCQNHR